MNHRLIESLWNKLSQSRAGRFLAAGLIGGLVGFSAGVSLFNHSNMRALSIGVGAAVAIIAVVILEAFDSATGRTKPRHTPVKSPHLPPHLAPPKIGDVKLGPVPPPLPNRRAP